MNSPTATLSANGGLIRAFIVEDSPVILENLIGTLTELAPVEVIGHCDTEEAAVRWMGERANDAQLLIIDVFLKSGSGLGVLRAAQARGLAAERVVLTNYATEDIRRQCAALGARRVFDKSEELDDLIDFCSALKLPPAA